MRFWLSGLLLVVAALGLVGPDHQYGEPELSTDGRTWSRTVGGVLFSPAARWVPGESRTAAFWVRSRDPGGADLSVDLRRTGGQGLGPPVSSTAPAPVRLEARLGTGEWVEIGPGGFHTLRASAPLGADERVPVTVRATVPTGLATTGMRGATDLDVRVSTVEADRFVGLRVPGGPGGLLPDTWRALGAVLLLPAALLLAAATLGVAAGQRRRTEEVTSDA